MASLFGIHDTLERNGVDELLRNIQSSPTSTTNSLEVGPPTDPLIHPAHPPQPTPPSADQIVQGIPPAMLAVDIGKIYLAIFNEYIIHRFGIHWPMTIYFRNDGINPWDMTLVAPNPTDHRRLPTMDDSRHSQRYLDIREALLSLADEWSLNINFL